MSCVTMKPDPEPNEPIENLEQFKTAQAAAKAWNLARGLGTAVHYQKDEQTKIPTETRSEAQVARSGDAVVLIKGFVGWIPLSKLSVEGVL